jgi:hypothetical protein
MATRIPKAETYVVSNGEKTGYIECRRCGIRHEYTLPMSVDAWVKVTRKFNKAHKDCPPPATQQPAGLCAICGGAKWTRSVRNHEFVRNDLEA